MARQSLAVSDTVRDRLNEVAKQYDLSQSDTVAMLLDILPRLKRAGIKVKRLPATTELEFPR